MCMMCEGFSKDDMLAFYAAKIAEHGCMTIGVGDPETDPLVDPWVYTIGLLDSADHPELIVAGIDLVLADKVLSWFVHRVRCLGERLAVGEDVDFSAVSSLGGVGRIGAVHPVQRTRHTFNMWNNLRDHGALGADECEAVQIFVPESWGVVFLGAQPDLSDPQQEVGRRVGGLDRAARRAAARGRYRPRRPGSAA